MIFVFRPIETIALSTLHRASFLIERERKMLLLPLSLLFNRSLVVVIPPARRAEEPISENIYSANLTSSDRNTARDNDMFSEFDPYNVSTIS